MATPIGPSITTPPSNLLFGSHHQLVKGPSVIAFPPSYFNPVPVAQVLKQGTLGVSYSETISAQGGTSPYSFAVTSGALPTGTSLNSSSGVISGTPSATGTFSFTITVTDANGYSGSQGFSIAILLPVSGGTSYGFIS